MTFFGPLNTHGWTVNKRGSITAHKVVMLHRQKDKIVFLEKNEDAVTPFQVVSDCLPCSNERKHHNSQPWDASCKLNCGIQASLKQPKVTNSAVTLKVELSHGYKVKDDLVVGKTQTVLSLRLGKCNLGVGCPNAAVGFALLAGGEDLFSKGAMHPICEEHYVNFTNGPNFEFFSGDKLMKHFNDPNATFTEPIEFFDISGDRLPSLAELKQLKYGARPTWDGSVY